VIKVVDYDFDLDYLMGNHCIESFSHSVIAKGALSSLDAYLPTTDFVGFRNHV